MSYYSRPGLLKAGDPGLPWLADSWPSTSLPANGGLGSPKGGNNFGRGDVLPSAAVEKTGTMLSDGAIYSSIDFMGKGGYTSPARGVQPTPYATTQILQSNSFHELAVDRPDPRWKASLQSQQEMANMGYSLTDRRPGAGAKVAKKKKIKGGTKTSKSNGTCWANMPLPPPPMHPLPGTEVDLDLYPQENHKGRHLLQLLRGEPKVFPGQLRENVEDQRLYSSPLPDVRPPLLISKGVPGNPMEEAHFSRLYEGSCSLGHDPKFMAIGEGRNVG
ncbi:hypothetical protein AMECASPLE_025041 [Ameca splendens]|uniref:Uncharacterized protein n=1 Tax=Ameca splendens TaxID=208324 RepID=A0ABV0Y4K5_9TELE